MTITLVVKECCKIKPHPNTKNMAPCMLGLKKIITLLMITNQTRMQLVNQHAVCAQDMVLAPCNNKGRWHMPIRMLTFVMVLFKFNYKFQTCILECLIFQGCKLSLELRGQIAHCSLINNVTLKSRGRRMNVTEILKLEHNTPLVLPLEIWQDDNGLHGHL